MESWINKYKTAHRTTENIFIESQQSRVWQGPLGPSDPNHCSSRATQSSMPGPCPSSFWGPPRKRLHSLPRQAVLRQPHKKKFFLMFKVPVCACCLLFWYWALMKKAWLRLLYTHPSDIYIHRKGLPCTFSSPALSAFVHIGDVPVPSSSSQPFAGLLPVEILQ